MAPPGRARGAYVVFVCEKMKECYINGKENLTFKAAVERFGAEWKEMDNEQRDPYQMISDQEKLRYRSLHPSPPIAFKVQQGNSSKHSPGPFAYKSPNEQDGLPNTMVRTDGNVEKMVLPEDETPYRKLEQASRLDSSSSDSSQETEDSSFPRGNSSIDGDEWSCSTCCSSGNISYDYETVSLPLPRDVVESIDESNASASERDENLRKILYEKYHNQINSVNFIIINFSTYYSLKTGMRKCPSEVGMCAFSLDSGVVDMYSTLIDPGEVPFEYSKEAKVNAKYLSVPKPNFDERCQDIKGIQEQMEKFLKKNANRDGINFVISPKAEMNIVNDCLHWISERTGTDFGFVVYPAGLTLHYLSRLGRSKLDENLLCFRKIVTGQETLKCLEKHAIKYFKHIIERYSLSKEFVEVLQLDSSPQILRKTPKPIVEKPDNISEETWLKESILLGDYNADTVLESTKDAYSAKIACPHHMMNIEGVFTCPLNFVNRHAFIMLDLLQKHFVILPVEGTHYPFHDSKKSMDKIRNILCTNWDITGYNAFGQLVGSREVVLTTNNSNISIRKPFEKCEMLFFDARYS